MRLKLTRTESPTLDLQSMEFDELELEDDESSHGHWEESDSPFEKEMKVFEKVCLFSPPPKNPQDQSQDSNSNNSGSGLKFSFLDHSSLGSQEGPRLALQRTISYGTGTETTVRFENFSPSFTDNKHPRCDQETLVFNNPANKFKSKKAQLTENQEQKIKLCRWTHFSK